MLYLISLGLYDEKDMSIRALEILKKCESVYVEFYTNKVGTDVKKLSELIKKPVRELDRSGMEEASASVLSESESKDVAIIVPGDALTATTHISLLLDAKREGIKTEIVHGSSIFTAVAETGLQLYKFGRVATLTEPLAISTLEAVKTNQKAGLHSLILLDIGMTATRALELLKDELKDQKVIAACQLGGDSEIAYGAIEELLKQKFEKEPAVIIVPGELHFMEKEFLDTLKN